MAGTQIPTAVTIINSLLSFQAISLTNFSTSAESIIAAGSKVEIASGFFTFDSAATPGATSWTAITTASTAYITCLPSGTAGSQVLTVDYSDVVPLWSDSKQGWYASAASITRYIGAVYKAGATSYENAFYVPKGVQELAYQIIPLGEWDMVARDTINVSHAIPKEKIKTISVTLREDSGTNWYELQTLADENSTSVGGGVDFITDINVGLVRRSGGTFDQAIFNATASTVANRGFCRVGFIL